MQMKTSALIGTIYIHAYTPVQTHTKTCACVCVNIHEHMCVIYVHVCVHLELAHVHPCTGVPARGHGQSVALTPETPAKVQAVSAACGQGRSAPVAGIRQSPAGVQSLHGHHKD